MEILAILFITVFLQGLLSAPAVSSEETVDCEQPKDTIQMQTCVKNEMDAADRELNKTYNSLYTELRRAKRKVLATKLSQEQRKWVKDRWKNCEDEGREEAGGGTAESLYFGSCYVRLTRERTLELDQRYRDQGQPKN